MTITQSYDDAVDVASNLIHEKWVTNSGGDEPQIFLKRNGSGSLALFKPSGITSFKHLSQPERGELWLFEQNTDTDQTIDILKNHVDVDETFAVEIRADTFARMQELYIEIERIQYDSLANPGDDLASPNTQFEEWGKLASPPNWERYGQYKRLINYYMKKWNKQVRD